MGDEKKSCWNGMVYSFFVGALLGAGLSFIFSPVSGKEARKVISDQFDELKDKVKKLEEKLHKKHD